MPGCWRTHATTSLSSVETKNMRSASERCAIEITAIRGRPSFVQRRRCTSSDSPLIHAWKPGEASMPLSVIASAARSFGG